MYDILKQIATDNSYGFTYARKDFQNLHDVVETVNPHIFLDPVQTDKAFGEYNQVERKTYTGSFMILLSSDIDEDYDTRYQTYIKPLIDTALGTISTAISCDESLQLTNWRETEVINVFDYNMDGILVTYTVVQDV